MRPPDLIIGIGNPSRGDDALGPLAIERLAALDLPEIELLTDFQLQVEHALDVEARREVIFIDAAVSGAEPFEFRAVAAAPEFGYSSHALSPGAVLATCGRIGISPPHTAWVLAIRGQRFGLGEPPSTAALRNLDAALAWLLARRRLSQR